MDNAATYEGASGEDYDGPDLETLLSQIRGILIDKVNAENTDFFVQVSRNTEADKYSSVIFDKRSAHTICIDDCTSWNTLEVKIKEVVNG